MMGEIYQEANKVPVWLSVGDEGELALESERRFVDEVSVLRKRRRTPRSDEAPVQFILALEWNALEHVCRLGYWERAWIIQ